MNSNLFCVIANTNIYYTNIFITFLSVFNRISGYGTKIRLYRLIQITYMLSGQQSYDIEIRWYYV